MQLVKLSRLRSNLGQHLRRSAGGDVFQISRWDLVEAYLVGVERLNGNVSISQDIDATSLRQQLTSIVELLSQERAKAYRITLHNSPCSFLISPELAAKYNILEC